jgi:hypothetical protein
VERFRTKTAGWKEATLEDLSSLGFKPEAFRKSLGDQEALLLAPPPALGDLDRPEFAALRRAFAETKAGRPVWVLYLWPRTSPWRPEDRAGFDARVRGDLGAAIPLLSAYHAPDQQAASVQRDLHVVGGIAIAAILLITVLSVGNLREGFVALLPILAATGMTLSLCTLLGGTLKSMNLAAIPILLGIGVDGGIHYVIRLRLRGDSNAAGTLADIGPGYWAATITTIIGFGSIATSETPGLSFMGVLVIVGMLAATATTLFMLPALASWKATLPPKDV